MNPKKLILLSYDEEYFTTHPSHPHKVTRLLKSIQSGKVKFLPVQEGGFVATENIKRIWVGTE
jgi:hypothetical protein